VTLQEVCLEAEARIRLIQRTLLDPQPELLDRCRMELGEVIELLEPRVTELLAAPNESDRAALERLRQAVAQIGTRVDQAANLCQGWAQLRLSTGYTAQGRPALPIESPKASFEA
jgi:hypothetical protein